MIYERHPFSKPTFLKTETPDLVSITDRAMLTVYDITYTHSVTVTGINRTA